MMLNGLVLGESLLNDAVALVLCTSIEEYERVSLTTKGGFEAGAFFLTVAKFFSILLGSVGLGAGVACVTALLTKEKPIEFPEHGLEKMEMRLHMAPLSKNFIRLRLDLRLNTGRIIN